MVVIKGKEKNEFIKTQINALYQKNQWNQRFWIGLKENGKEGSYVWVDDTGLTFGKELKNDPWLDSEPNQVKTNDIFNIILLQSLNSTTLDPFDY